MYPYQTNENKLQPIRGTASGNYPLTNHTISEEPQRVSRTEEETIALHEAVSKVSNLIAKLQERLRTVSRDSNPQTSGSEKVEESIPVLANAIRQSRYVAQSSIYQLEDILERLDI